MSPREKKLLIFFASAGFIVLNFIGFNFLSSKKIEVNRALDEAKLALERAKMFSASREEVADQMTWLAEHEPEPAANQNVQTKLQQFCEAEAKTAGLTIKTQKPLPTEAAEGLNYHRAKIQITLTGTEKALYGWFDRITAPDQFRGATVIRLAPNSKDDTQIDCTATIEQWFVPAPQT